MRPAAAVLLLTAAALGAVPQGAQYTLVFWDTPKARVAPTLTRAVFGDAGKLLAQESLSKDYSGLGPLSVSAARRQILFSANSASGESGIWTGDLADDGALASTPKLFTLPAASLASLLEPCKPDCVDVQLLQGTWSGDDIAFMYRALAANGMPQWAQAIGVAAADGSGARPASFNATRQDGELAYDKCPQPFGAEGGISFIRTTDAGMHERLWVAPRGGGEPRAVAGVPPMAHKAGCPTALGSGEVVYMACIGDDNDCVESGLRRGENGKLARPRGAGNGGAGAAGAVRYVYGKVRGAGASGPATFDELFTVPLVNQPSWLGTYGRTQCRGVVGGGAQLSCLAAPSYTNDDVMELSVDLGTGHSVANASVLVPSAALAPRCYEVLPASALAPATPSP